MRAFSCIFFAFIMMTASSMIGCGKKDVKTDGALTTSNVDDNTKNNRKIDDSSKTYRNNKDDDNKIAIKDEDIKDNDTKGNGLKEAEDINKKDIEVAINDKSDAELEKEAKDAASKYLELQKIYFDYDKSDLREDAKKALETNAEVLKNSSNANFVIIEGHCDERGTEEYNIALGQRRAESVKKFLVSLGISESKLSTNSFGEAKPEVDGHDESAWHFNRRAVLKEVAK